MRFLSDHLFSFFFFQNPFWLFRDSFCLLRNLRSASGCCSLLAWALVAAIRILKASAHVNPYNRIDRILNLDNSFVLCGNRLR
ncbi:hypothetical protein TsFJ059_001937 [Trichoderma semiorbis]|uniref:Uncharacterized protein n=1 Tax=Trichoderma semiorbis TaxID=1491008 RepID=A0A9P8I0J9_9HYPO|nr:hypothetical protein TsFJ059_001937 [Trichoderma semiorbis]